MKLLLILMIIACVPMAFTAPPASTTTTTTTTAKPQTTTTVPNCTVPKAKATAIARIRASEDAAIGKLYAALAAARNVIMGCDEATTAVLNQQVKMYIEAQTETAKKGIDAVEKLAAGNTAAIQAKATQVVSEINANIVPNTNEIQSIASRAKVCCPTQG